MKSRSAHAYVGAVLISIGASLPCEGISADVPGDARPAHAAADIRHYTISSQDSDIRFLVYRAGLLAALGHNHVIRAQTVHGSVFGPSTFPWGTPSWRSESGPNL